MPFPTNTVVSFDKGDSRLTCASFRFPVKVYISPGLAGRRTYPPLHPHLRRVTPLAAGKPRHHLPYFALPRDRDVSFTNASERMRGKGRVKRRERNRGQTIDDLNCRRDTVRATNEFRRKIRAAIRRHSRSVKRVNDRGAPDRRECAIQEYARSESSRGCCRGTIVRRG